MLLLILGLPENGQFGALDLEFGPRHSSVKLHKLDLFSSLLHKLDFFFATKKVGWINQAAYTNKCLFLSLFDFITFCILLKQRVNKPNYSLNT